MPALLTSTSGLPNASMARSIIAPTSSGLVMSTTASTASAPPSRSRSTAVTVLSSSMSAITTWAPARERRSAMANPIPRAAPVTIATFSGSSKNTIQLLSLSLITRLGTYAFSYILSTEALQSRLTHLPGEEVVHRQRYVPSCLREEVAEWKATLSCTFSAQARPPCYQVPPATSPADAFCRPEGRRCGGMDHFSSPHVADFTVHPPSNVGQLPRPRISRSLLHRGSRHNHPLSRAASQGSGWPNRRTPASASWDSLREGARLSPERDGLRVEFPRPPRALRF